MCSTDFGMLDLLFDKEDSACKSLDGFKNTLFSTSEVLDAGGDAGVKEEVLDSGTIDWKMSNEWDADELLRSVLDGNDMSHSYSAPSLDSLGGLGSSHHTLDPSSLATPTLEAPDDDMDSLENLVGLPFHAVLDSAASDSGMSSDSSLDQQMSPLSGYSSPGGSLADVGLGGGLDVPSPDPALDATSDVSSSSDLGSLGSLGSTSPSGSSPIIASPRSPETILGLEDFIHPDSGFSSPVPQVVNTSSLASSNGTATPIFTTTRPATFVTKTVSPTTTIVTKPAVATIVTKPSATISTGPVLKTVTVAAPASSVGTVGGQTIVVTQANRGGGNAHVVRGSTLLKSNNNTSRSILLPVTMKDLNQVRTIKIISTGGSGGEGGRGVRTVVSTVRTPSTTTSTTSLSSQSIRTALLGTVRGQESKSILKSGATTLLTTSGRPITTTTTVSAAASTTHMSPTRIKVEARDDDDDDDDDDDHHTSFQQLTLSDEEKRLLKKEGIMLPSHYPLTKQEERELKRIRRKIRNKISAQDSRKRKKEYIDGLEDRVKACTEENQQLQKRIRSLEAQNESLLVQMRRFQNAVTGGNPGRLQTHASTALMMLILSAALFVVPSMRQDGAATSDSELSMPASKMPPAGHTRSLLEVGNKGTLELLEGVEDELTLEMETPLSQALSDHDYTPVAKKQRISTPRGTAYFVPPLDDYPPLHGKTDSGGGFPPDDSGSGTKLSARILDSLADHLSNNYSDPGGKTSTKAKAVVVNLSKGKKRLRDDLELE